MDMLRWAALKFPSILCQRAFTLHCLRPGSSSSCSQRQARDRFLCVSLWFKTQATRCPFLLLRHFSICCLSPGSPSSCSQRQTRDRFPPTQPSGGDFFPCEISRFAVSGPEVPQHVHCTSGFGCGEQMTLVPLYLQTQMATFKYLPSRQKRLFERSFPFIAQGTPSLCDTAKR